jgi:prepilin-type N-terminal cleavage/methylation domain-containing protein
MKININSINKRYKNQQGFSFVEMIISLSLLVMISSLIFFSFNSLNNKQSLDKQVDFIKSSINQTRTNAINSKNNSNQSILFSSTSISYDDKIIDLENNISLMSYTIATNTINFSRISGIPNATGTLVYKLQKGDTIIATSSIIVNNLGIIE